MAWWQQFHGYGYPMIDPSRVMSPYMRPIPADPNEAIRLARQYISTAEQQNDNDKLNTYDGALRICGSHNFNGIAADIHCKIAEVYLRKRQYEMARIQAEESITCNPDCLQGYYQRAESLREQVHIHIRKRTQMYNPSLAKTLSANAIRDYLYFYKKTPQRDKDKSSICKALILAVDSGNIDLLPLVDLVETKEDCTDLVLKLIALCNSRCKHLDYLIRETTIKGSGYALRLECDLSQVKCLDMLRKPDINGTTFEAALKLGVSVNKSDIENAIEHINESKLSVVLELIISACNPPLNDELTTLCCSALSAKRLNIAACLISHGAKPQSSEVFKVLDWKNLNEKLVTYVISTPCGSALMVKKAVGNPSYTKVVYKCIEGEFGLLNTELIDLSELLSSNSFQNNPDLLEKLLSIGVNPNGLTDSRNPKPLDIVLAMPRNSTKEKIEFLCALSKNGASLKHATYPQTQGTTIVHMATDMALETGDTTILETVCSHYPFPEDGKLTDKESKTPLHHVMHRKYNEIAEKACQILSNYINPHVQDNHGKKASEYRPEGDKRQKLLLEARKKFPSMTKSHKGEQKKGGKHAKAKGGHTARDTTRSSTDEPTPDCPDAQTESQSDSKVKSNFSSNDVKPGNSVLQSVQKYLDNFSRKPDSYFKQPPDYKRQSSSQKSDYKQQDHKKEGVSTTPTPEITVHQTDQDKPIADKQSPDPDEDEDGETNVKEKTFDGLPWEVEFPEKVLKFFKDPKVPRYIRENAITKIQRLAHGIPTHNQKLCKVLVHSPNLFEARVTKAVRIIYEIAVQFSSRLTNSQQHVQHVYSDVIRIWEIVLDHDNLDHSIEVAVDRIQKSNQRGKSANTITPLNLPVQKDTVQHRGEEELRFPRSYVDSEVDEMVATQVATQISFTPAGSAREDEYNVVTFYTFDSAFVKSMLEGENARRDFPFKEWPKEHDIISMKQGACSILLLGRSGTGKTTCCLYRLWNHFQSYWAKANDAGPLTPRIPLIPYSQDEEVSEETYPDDACSAEEQGKDSDPSQDEAPMSSNDLLEEETHQDLEHFHQVFVTKNYVLCAQMKRRFYDLAAGNDVAENHMPFEDKNLPSTIAEIENLAYPLFLTARQFFILLDNSLGDGQNFFYRDENGELKEKILSSDYDHEDPDTLIDLEFESDTDADESDEEGEVESQPISSKRKLLERKEVTAFYFAEKIWPKISHFCQDKKTDPLLVWMEIKSFIKGSRRAVQSEHGYLTEQEYEEIGKKMASNFVGNRKEVYKLFEKYQHFLKQTTEENLFDECELVHNIYSRLNKLQELPWSVHSFYIDEVQDFTQAELSVLLRCCRDPNDLFLTGDTAQSIMRGISFRFSDLRSLFHSVKTQAKKVKKLVTVAIPKVHELTINFRSHSGVLQLAASVIDLLKEYFPSSFDRLPGDEGMFPGPIPKVLDSCNVSDLALVLRGNKRESTTIEFGAHQVIIVQSEEAKKALPDVLQAGIVLTVFEAKGLEFDDVLLYDFFKYSKVTKEWRVVRSYLESKPDLKTNTESGFSSEPRPLKFDEQHHKSLNAELKYLYTAITRAKCNLWIYDSDKNKRLPMFDYWHRRGLVKVIRVNEISQEDHNILFAATSTKEEWKEQGDYFKKKRLWEPAMKCYQKAEDIHLEREAKAYFLVQQARALGQKPQEMQEHYLKAALAFFECDKFRHNHKCLRYAAMCLKNSKRHTEAGKLYARLDKHKEAFKQFKKSNNIPACAQLKEEMGDYNGAVMLLVNSRRIIDALEHANRYEKQGVELKQELTSTSLANSFAIQLLQEGKHKQLVKVAEYIPDVGNRVHYLKAAGKFDEVFRILRQERQYEQMYKLYDTRGEHSKGLRLAEAKRDEKWIAIFVFNKATVELVSNGRIENPDIVSQLKCFLSGEDVSRKARACLLLGMSSKDVNLCRRALEHYNLSNPAGYVEAFNFIVEQKQPIHYSYTIKACSKATDIIAAVKHFKEKSNQHQLVMKDVHYNTLVQVEDFYGLQKQHGRNEYHFPSREGKYLWISFGSSSAMSDLDGVMVLEAEYALSVVCQRMEQYLKMWKIDDELGVCKTIRQEMVSYQFHKQLEDEGYLQQSFRIMYPAAQLYGYLRLLNTGLQLCEFGRPATFHKEDLVRLLIVFISPEASMHLDVIKGHMGVLKQSTSGECMLNLATSILDKSDGQFSMDEWLEVWRIHSVMGKGTVELDRNLQSRVNKMPVPAPLSFRFDSYHKKYDHIFALWLKSCFLIRKENKVMTSCKLMLHFVLDIVARRRTLRSTLSVTNLVNILTVHSVALLSLATVCNQSLKQSFKAFVPSSYQHVIKQFDNLNRQNDIDKRLLEACMVDVTVLKARANNQSLLRVRDDIVDLLWQVLDMLLGKYNGYTFFNPLKHAVETEKCLQRGEARHCLVLALILFSNLVQTGNSDTDVLYPYQLDIHHAVKLLAQHHQKFASARDQFAQAASTIDALSVVNLLLKVVDQRDMLVQIITEPRPWKFSFKPCSVQRIPLLPLKPIPPEIHTSVPLVQVKQNQPAAMATTASSPVSVQSQPTTVPTPSTHTLEGLQKSQVHPADTYQSPVTEIQGSNKEDSHTIATPPKDHPNPSLIAESLPITEPTQLARIVSHEPEEGFEPLEDMDDDDLREALQPQITRQYSHDNEQEPSSLMIEQNLCKICAIPLRPDNIAGEDTLEDRSHEGEQSAEIIEEGYTHHLESKKHAENSKLYERFTTAYKEYYEPVKEKLQEELKRCVLFTAKNLSPTLNNTIATINEEIRQNEKEILRIRNSAGWRVGVSSIQNDMYGRMDSLIQKAIRELKKEEEKVKQEKQLELRKQEEPVEEEEDNIDAEEEELNDDVNKPDWRQKKRDRKLNQRKRRK